MIYLQQFWQNLTEIHPNPRANKSGTGAEMSGTDIKAQLSTSVSHSTAYRMKFVPRSSRATCECGKLVILTINYLQIIRNSRIINLSSKFCICLRSDARLTTCALVPLFVLLSNYLTLYLATLISSFTQATFTDNFLTYSNSKNGRKNEAFF